MTNTLLVQSQYELDKALADGVADLRIEHPLGIFLTISDDPGFCPILWGNSHAELQGNASAELRENASATLLENASATLWGNSSAELSRFTVARLHSPSAKATGTGHVIDMAAVDLGDPALWADFHGVKVVE